MRHIPITILLALLGTATGCTPSSPQRPATTDSASTATVATGATAAAAADSIKFPVATDLGISHASLMRRYMKDGFTFSRDTTQGLLEVYNGHADSLQGASIELLGAQEKVVKASFRMRTPNTEQGLLAGLARVLQFVRPFDEHAPKWVIEYMKDQNHHSGYNDTTFGKRRMTINYTINTPHMVDLTLMVFPTPE